MESLHRRGTAESARLEALLRKAEVRAMAAETALDQKAEEGRELTQICDELIARVEKSGGGDAEGRGQ